MQLVTELNTAQQSSCETALFLHLHAERKFPKPCLRSGGETFEAGPGRSRLGLSHGSVYTDTCPHRSFCAHLPGRAAIPEPVPTVFLPAVINKEPAVGPIVFQRRERERITSWRWYYSSLRARVPPDVPVTAPDAPWQTAPLTALRAAGAERPPSRRRLTPFRDFRWREAQCGRDGGAGAEVRCRRLPRQGAERAAAGAAGEEARGRQRGGSAAPRAAVGTLRSPLGCRCRGCRAAGVPRAPDKMEALSAPRAPGRWRGGGCSPGAGFLAVRSCPGEERGGRGRAVS